MSGPPLVYGLLAEFSDPTELVAAAQQTRAAGYTKFDAYTPFPIEELAEALGRHRSVLPLLVLIGGIVGGVAGFALCYWTSVIDYPLIVGGRPFNSWPSYIPVIFECTILGAALTAVPPRLTVAVVPSTATLSSLVRGGNAVTAGGAELS